MSRSSRARRLLARKLEVSRAAEARYARALRAVLREVHKDLLRFLLTRSDASLPTDFGQEVTRLLDGIPVRVGTIFDRHARQISDANKRSLRLVGIRAFSDAALEPAIAVRRAENIDLVVNAGRAYAESVREIFSDPEHIGLRVEELQAKLEARGDVSESRAELIARDQTLKLNGALTQIRQESAGVDEYIWSTSLDERVRDSHRALEGERFSWSSPPEPGHPGQDYQCRCVALPVVPELEDL